MPSELGVDSCTASVAGTAPTTVIGYGVQPGWDAILIVEYPSPQAFLDMIADPDYLAVRIYRSVGFAEVLECHHVTGSDAFVLKVAASSVGHLEAVIEGVGRWGTPATSIILSSPVARREITSPAAWPLRRARRAATATRRRVPRRRSPAGA